MQTRNSFRNAEGIILRTCKKCVKDLPLFSSFIKKQRYAFGKKYSCYSDYCKECEALYERMGIPLEEEVEYDVASFIYNAF